MDKLFFANVRACSNTNSGSKMNNTTIISLHKITIVFIFLILGITGTQAQNYVPPDTVSINFKIDRFADIELKDKKFTKGKDKHLQLKNLLNSSKFIKKVKRLHANKTYEWLHKEREEYKQKGILLPKLANWYTISTKNLSVQEIADISYQLNEMPFIETVEYITPAITADIHQCPSYLTCEPPPGDGGGSGSTSTTPDLTSYQDYLGQAPLGIDAHYAWTLPGGSGAGVKIIDMENGYNEYHEDISAPFIRINDSNNGDHGTAVMSIIGAKNNGFGMTGIAHGSQIGFYGWGGDIADAIAEATDYLSPGDILILEVHINRNLQSGDSCTSTDQEECVPVEWMDSYFQQIEYATKKGINVIEAAGNGNEDLDSSIYLNKFDRNERDSGAFLIAATNPTSTINRSYFSNYGTRIDFNGWGSNVAAAGAYGTLLFDGGQNRVYGDGFSGTSSASPIVAGAVASLVGHGKAQLGKTLSIAEVKALITNYGTQPPSGQKVGVRPNLRSSIDNFNNSINPAETTLSSDWMGCQGRNTISWGAISNATTYQLFISTQTTPPNTPIYTETSTYKSLSVNSDSYAWVKACDANGCSDFSNMVYLRYENYCV